MNYSNLNIFTIIMHVFAERLCSNKVDLPKFPKVDTVDIEVSIL